MRVHRDVNMNTEAEFVIENERIKKKSRFSFVSLVMFLRWNKMPFTIK